MYLRYFFILLLLFIIGCSNSSDKIPSIDENIEKSSPEFQYIEGMKKFDKEDFNEANLITCFSNDYGYENWMKKSLEVHAEKNDVLIIISSSGESQNVINLANQGKKMGLKKIITLTGFQKSNRLRKKGDINIWIDSKRYNFVENTHQLILLSIVDLISKT